MSASDRKPTADWDKIGDRFYRKIQLYSHVFDPDVELENYTICGAPFGGAIALHRKQNAIYAYRGETTQSSIDLYSCAGKLLRRISWDKAPIVGLGWTENETLVVVSRDGVVRCYAGLSDDFTPFNLGHGAEEHEVVDCRFWHSGFVARLANNQVVAVTSYDEPRPKLLATPPSDTVISWAVVPPAFTLSRTVEVLLAIGQTINVVDPTDSEDRMLQNGPFRHICISPNGRFIALYTDDGKVWVISSDFQEKFSEYSSRMKRPPKDMQWCGNDAVMLAWEDEVHLVGPNGAASKYFYDGFVHLIPDVDGIRLLTNDLCDFVTNVPDASENTFKIGSSSPASVLLDCVEQLEKKSPKADDNIQMIRPHLVDAVETCVAAAGHEFSIHWQKQLLKAASFGKTVLDLFDSYSFVKMTEDLRVLNAVRSFKIGMPVSYDQFTDWLGPDRLIERLLNRQEYSLALRLSQYLRVPEEKTYLHWAIEKVRISTEDEDKICQEIVQKSQSGQGISFEEVARAAHEEGRNHLATELLNHEPRAGKQVPLLLDMEEDTIALDKAIESGDTDLIQYVLFSLRRKLPQATFFRTVNTRPVATALLETASQDQDKELLKDLYYQDDRRLDGSNLLFRDALSQTDAEAKFTKLKVAAKIVQDSKENTFQTRSIDDFQRLIRVQESLDTDSNLQRSITESGETDDSLQAAKFSGMSLYETIHMLFRIGQHKRALKLVSDFSVPERTLWQIRLRALVAARSFRDLEDLAAKNKKSPIGWEPFFHETLKAGALKTAAVFIGKFTDREKSPRERGEMYVMCGMFGKAAEEAWKAKDKSRLEELRGQATGRDLLEVERYIALLTKGK